MKSLLAACLLAFLAGCSLGEGEAEAVDIEPFLKLLPEEVARASGPVEDSKNALPFLLEAVDSYVEPDDATDEWVADLFGVEGYFPAGPRGEAIEKWLRRNRNAIEAMTGMAKREKLRFPSGFLKEEFRRKILPEGLPFGIGEDRTSGFMVLIHSRRLSYLEIAHAKHRERQGDEEGTVESLLRLLRLGDLVADSECSLLAYLVGSATGSIGRGEVRWFLARPESSEGAMVRLLDGLRGSTERAAAEGSLRAELLHFVFPSLVTLPESPPRALAEALVKGKWLRKPDVEKRISDTFLEILEGHPRPYDREETIRLAGKRFAGLLDELRGPWKIREIDREEELADILAAWPRELDFDRPEGPLLAPDTLKEFRRSIHGITNPVGKLLLEDVFFPNVVTTYTGAEGHSLRQGIFEAEADRQATICIVALRIHELRKGALPTSLDDLVSAGILTTVPVDPYGNRPLSWSLDRKLVWSVGPEGKGEALLDATEARGRWVWEVR